MANEMISAESRPAGNPVWRGDAFMAFAATLVVLAVAAAGGFQQLAGNPDNDSSLRLVEVRDLIAGQGWFDLYQYRMGLADGFLMHWSRLVDAPIAGIVLPVTALTGSQEVGEKAALVLWPLILFGLALYLLLRMGRVLGGEQSLFPVLVLGAATLFYGGAFGTGSLDHHNIQIVAMLATVLFLLRAGDDARYGALAGIASVFMLAIGMETAPYVAAAGLIVAGWFLFRGEEAAAPAAWFGWAFAASSAVVFVGTVPWSQWSQAHCDAYSVVQFAIGALAGAGLATVVSIPRARRGMASRAVALLALGGAVGVLTVALFPQCLADPYAGLDPLLKTNWLDGVDEAQPLWRMLATEPESVAEGYVTVVLGLVVLALRIRRHGIRRQEAMLATMLVVALLVSVWQVRGTRFALPLACVPLGVWVSGFRSRALAEPGTVSSLKVVGAWLVSFNIIWMLVSSGISNILSPAAATQQSSTQTCYKRSDYALLGALPPQRVLAISNLGASMLRYTPHSVLAGPYHRNIDGNLATLNAFMGQPDEARRIMRESGVSLVAFCPGNAETGFLARRSPDGLLSLLLAGTAPAWMELVPESDGKAIRFYKIAPE